MAVVWFVRHGESVSNANLPTVHPALSELTAVGWQEAHRVAGVFSATPDLIVTSSYARARETAVPTIQRFPHVPQETWPVHEFTYLHPERYQGTRGRERGPWAEAYWLRCDPEERENEGGESFAELMSRGWEVLAHCAQRQEKWIVVFSHGMFIRCLLWLLITQYREPTPEAMRRYGRFLHAIHVPNGAIWPVIFTPSRPPQFSGFITHHLATND